MLLSSSYFGLRVVKTVTGSRRSDDLIVYVYKDYQFHFARMRYVVFFGQDAELFTPDRSLLHTAISRNACYLDC